MDYLKETVHQGIRLSKNGAEDYAEICSSRIGGDPDLPPNAAWPLDEEHDFVFQLAGENMYSWP
ncbi:hypothetical protein [Paenibacillus macerans]|uniref:hypothetical protein n=1 Tax=Paenibacillus macerans TaxID=44252 RepID=UPI003D31C0D9